MTIPYKFKKRKKIHLEKDIICHHPEWAIKKLVPWGKLKKALRSGITEPWQVAEEFNITDEFAVKVMEYYFKS